MNNNLKDLETAVEAFIAKEENLTPERIRELIEQFRVIPSFNVDDISAEKLARTFESRHSVSMTIGSVLTEHGFKPWLQDVRSEIIPYYWDRYKKLLFQQHFPSQVIASLDRVTDRTLGLMENPLKESAFDRRGMVMGHVQSGKTANYIGLICKAADAGYKLIIVIAGIHNNLRSQTQKRIDEGVVGRDSSGLSSNNSDKYIGVGKFDNSRKPVTFTNSYKDFTKEFATRAGIPLHSLTEPAVLVIKKNTTTLNSVIEWLREHNAKHGSKKVDIPMMLIDDEADNASINIKYGKAGVSKINGQIRSLLQMFERSCYVGYTATPFANIFIDPDSEDEMLGEDLFPRHFIVSLDPPSNYFGPQKVFLEDSESIIRYIDDSEDLLPLKHPKETTVDTLPPSLVTAVRSFIVARAIRLARGHENQHCSMLVNVSRFTDVQRQIRNLIHNKLVEIQASARTYAALPKEAALASPEILSLYEVWKKEFEATGTKWQTIQERLNQASAPVAVIEVNSKSSDRLNYEDYKDSGLSVIAVGGFSLSRGLTLEGLLISYFLRNSMMYDTLMQMGRWFGYRPDYSDLCRVWMLEEAEGWYSHIAESIEILREDLRSMEAAGGTPEDFGLKVRSHPYNLIITARNKIGSGEKVILRIGLANNFIETATLKPDPESLSRNRKVLITLVDNLSKSGLPVSQSQQLSSGWLLQKVHSRPVIRFLDQFQNHEGSLLTDPRLVIPYIEDRCDDELSEWDIFFPSVNKDVNNRIVDNSLGIRIVCQQRTAGDKSDPSTLLITNKQRVASRGVEKVGLSKDSIEKAQQDFKKNKPDNLNFPDKIYRKERKRPLLIIHLLTILEPRLEMNFEEPVVAWSISFPTTNYEGKRVEYVVNTTWLKENFKYDLEEEEISGDD